MTTPAPEAPPATQAPAQDPPQASEPPKATEPPQSAEPPKPEIDWVAEARKWEARAKENKKAADELDRQRKASMTEAERAVAEAEARGRTTAVADFGKRLARTQFDSLAGRRNATFDTAPVFEYLDLARFVGDDGEPDVKAITAAVERLVPEPQNGPPSFDGGARRTADKAPNMNELIRQRALGQQ